MSQVPQQYLTVLVAGVDEAGRGPLAGPVTAACVVLRPGYRNARITDSKKLSKNERELLFPEIVANSLAYAIVSVGPRRIEMINIRAASLEAMRLAALRTEKKINLAGIKAKLFYLVDGNISFCAESWSEAIVKGDAKITCISAASILAKVARDRQMALIAKRYPGYEFEIHKGYPTAKHFNSIKKLGPAAVHRRTFTGVKEYVSKIIKLSPNELEFI